MSMKEEYTAHDMATAAAAGSAEEEEEVEVEVVAWRYRHSEQEKWQAGVERKSLWETEPLMTVAQHERIVAALSAQAAPQELRIVLDGPPGPEAGRFVEVENAAGRSVNAGEWRERADGLWELVLHATQGGE